MSSLNKVLLIGNLGRDPETRYMPNGECVTKFPLATSERWIDKQTGKKQEKTEWHNIIAFRKIGEICAQYLKKGSSIYCEGKLNTQKYIDKDGIEKHSTQIVIDSLQMLGGRPPEQSGGIVQQKGTVSPQGAPTTPPPPLATNFDNMEEDDIPF